MSAPDVSQRSAEGASPLDVLVVGGGINGVGLARDLAGRGLSVMLAEQDDLASHTSSSSTKLIHGGLRYLEYYEFGLVRKALAEREVLLRSAPHIMWPLRFVMPHDPAMRPAWLIRAGLFLYDHLARRKLLPGSCGVDLRQHEAGAALQPRFKRGFLYSDGWVDDARLVVLLAMDAAERDAQIRTRCRVTEVQRTGALWTASLCHADGRVEQVSARVLVNATGPWASQFLHDCVRMAKPRPLRLVKGSHVVVPKMFAHDHAYIFQNADRRIIFAIPYEQDFTLIGTTDQEYRGKIGQAHIDASEMAYLCEQASRYFKKPVKAQDVVWSYSGVRPLLDEGDGTDASAVTRDYELEVDRHGAPLMSIWGGKITTFRKLAEEAANQVCALLGQDRPSWTADAVLPGGDFTNWGVANALQTGGKPALDKEAARRFPAVPEAVRRRWLRSYGTRMTQLLAEHALGDEVAPGLYEAEMHYLYHHEWARCADDVLWRRSKLGLHLDADARAQVVRWCNRHWPALGGTTRHHDAHPRA